MVYPLQMYSLGILPVRQYLYLVCGTGCTHMINFWGELLGKNLMFLETNFFPIMSPQIITYWHFM